MPKLPFLSPKPPTSLPNGNGGGKLFPASTDRTRAQTPDPAPTTGQGENKTYTQTFFTQIPATGQGAQIIYNGDRIWGDVTLELETAGPVAVSTLADIFPVLSGKGILLDTGLPQTFRVAKGNRLYVAATSVNRIKVTVAPVPWLETITGLITAIARRFGISL